MRGWARTALALAASAGVVAGCGSDEPHPRGTSSPTTPSSSPRCVSGPLKDGDVPPRIAFLRADAATVYSMITARPDGSDETLVHRWRTDGLDFIEGPFTPDGRRVLFEVYRGPGRSAARWYVVDKPGARPRRFTTLGAGDSSPAFSPDGRCLAFSRAGSIWTRFADGHGRPVRVTTGPRHDEAAWSPDGTTIAFTSSRPGGKHQSDDRSEVATVRADGRGKVRILSRSGLQVQDRTPAWSPDSRTIVFARWDPDEVSEVWTVPSGGGAPTLVSADRDRSPFDPVFTPDGDRIIFSASVRADPGNEEFGSQVDLFSMTLRGADRRHVTDTGEPISEGHVVAVGSP